MEVHSLDEHAGVSKVKKRLRDLQRLHKKLTAPGSKNNNSEKIQDCERAVKVAKEQLKEAEALSKKKSTASKYKMVRFFDMKKAQRRLKKAKNNLRNQPNDADAKHNYDNSLLDYLYIKNFPLDYKYLSIYVTNSVVGSEAEDTAASISDTNIEKTTDKTLKAALIYKKELKNKIENGSIDTRVTI